jgi:voltage-gated potassium channel
MSDEREELRERIESWTEGPLNVLGVVLLVVLVAEFAADLSPAWQSRLDTLNWFIYIVFTASFVVQLALAPDKRLYLRRNWIAAISVVLPAFRVFRVLRAVRALRGLRLVRVLTATNRGTRSLSRMLRGHQFGRVMGLTAAVVLVGAAALVYFEGKDAAAYGDALWWSLALVTTVGSDFQPETLEGRVVTLALIVWGLGVFGYITAAVASYFVGKDAAAGPGEGGSADAVADELRSLRAEITELRAILARSGSQEDETA